ncbi:MAG: TIGR04219 family outer membrane beta-barrel protein [Desulfobacterales bacterium]|nr:TIGR04219 family outer membrane beta-barrel protein [Desulfobacterales bacterium]
MRIRKMTFVFCLLAVLPMLMPAPAAALPLIDMEAAVGGWGASASGGVKYDGVTEGTNLDLEDDFNYDDETALTGRLKIDMPLVIPNLYLMATPLDYEEKATRSQTFRFGEEQYDANVEYNSRLTLDTYDIGLFYNVPLLETVTLGRLGMEAGLNARIIDAEALVEQKATGYYEKKSETLPLPMLYVGLGLYPVDRFGLEAEARGISYSDYELVSLIGRLKVNVFGPLFVSGGYRYDAYDIEEDDLVLDVDFSGPFLETGLKF